MNIKRYAVTIIIGSIIVSVFIVLIMLIEMCLKPYYRLDKKQIEKSFSHDKNDMIFISDYLGKYNQSIEFDYFDFKAKNYESIIANKEIVDTMIRLFEKGYSVIGKKDNTIYFKKWSRGDGFAVGIAHSINGVDEPQLECLTRLEPLSENGWYFYEINYNEGT